MKLFKKLSVVVANCILSLTAYAAEITPIGYWKTIDDKTGEAKSIVHISQGSDHTLSGKVVKLYKDPKRLCTACEGDKKDQPVMGMEVVYGLKETETNKWSEGEILDPKSGKVYRCTMRVTDNGNKLEVHGYIGIQLLGRTQTWLRVTRG